VTVPTKRHFKPRSHLVAIALLSFIFSFAVARTFTTFFPSTVLITNGVHIHHFWFGLALLAVGGWLGISLDGKESSRVAAILYGAGGGLIVDEVGLLLTFGNYQTSLTYSFLIVFLAFISILILFYRYRLVIVEELAEFASSKLSLYLGVFLLAISIAFVIQTDNFWVTIIAGGLMVAAILLVIIYLIVQVKLTDRTKRLPTK
jgi:hypothetical protein